MGEERELLMALALNRARVASQRELAVAYWGPAEVERHWVESYWMRAHIRYRLKVAREIERGREAVGGSETDGG